MCMVSEREGEEEGGVEGKGDIERQRGIKEGGNVSREKIRQIKRGQGKGQQRENNGREKQKEKDKMEGKIITVRGKMLNMNWVTYQQPQNVFSVYLWDVTYQIS